MHVVDIVVVCAAVLVLLAFGLVLARQRFMLRASGTIPVALRSRTGRWQYGVARYVGSELRWYRSLGLGTRPNRTWRRGELSLDGRRARHQTEKGALPFGTVIVECRDGADTTTLAFGDSAYTGFVSWLEASAPMS